jgi:hypothetical protein
MDLKIPEGNSAQIRAMPAIGFRVKKVVEHVQDSRLTAPIVSI